MSYAVFSFLGPLSSKKMEILLAQLMGLGFEAFEEKDQELDAYLKSHLKSPSLMQQVQDLAHQFQCQWSERELKEENWNAQWEASFHPVQVDDFCGIRADFHPNFEGVTHSITINPKMAFGTGHHETTHLVIEMMKELSLSGKSVFDYGCGTGILAILASKMGATDILALDYDENATENALENLKVNGVENVTIATGELKDFQIHPQDLVLANINKPVLMDSIPCLAGLLTPEGTLILSGIMEKDQGDIEKLAYQSGLQTLTIHQKGEWLAIKYGRQTTV
jgi:ribosomal protein L11 methyltransferase